MKQFVFKESPKIILNKFLKGLMYTVIVFLITLGLNALAGGILPPEYSIYASLIYNVLSTVKKGLDEYKPEYAEKFEWFYTAIIEYVMNLFKKK